MTHQIGRDLHATVRIAHDDHAFAAQSIVVGTKLSAMQQQAFEFLALWHMWIVRFAVQTRRTDEKVKHFCYYFPYLITHITTQLVCLLNV